MIRVKDIEGEIFDTPYITIFPKECKDCGGDIFITDSLTHLFCENPTCKGKVIDRLKYLLKNLGINIDNEKVLKFIEKHKNMTSPFYIFLYNPKKDGVFYEGATKEESEDIYREINRNRTMMLWEYIYIGYLPFIKETAEVLFRDYTDIETFYSELSEEGMGFIQRLLKESEEIEENEQQEDYILAQTILIYDTLNTYKKEIINGLKGVTIPKASRKIPVYFGSSIKTKETIREVIQKINYKYSGKIYIYRTYDLDSAEFIYWDSSKNNKKTEFMKYIDAYYRYTDIINYENLESKVGVVNS